MSLKHAKPYRFEGTKGYSPVTLYSERGKRGALMEHLMTATRRAGHQISLREAMDPDSDLVLISPDEYLRFHSSFEQAAEKAWKAISAPQEPKKFTFQTNKGGYVSIPGETEKDALLVYLIDKTKKAGHQITFGEAENPALIKMIKPSEFVQYFGKFDEAARRAWICAQTKPSESGA